MFDHLSPANPDPIMHLMEQYLEDPNPQKVNLGIGLYYDDDAQIPLMKAVRIAEQQILQQAKAHLYPPIEGLSLFNQLAKELTFPNVTTNEYERIATVQTLGGSGALKLGAEFLHHHYPQSGIWLSTPTWANHHAIFKGAKLEINSYPYYDSLAGDINFHALLDTFMSLSPYSIVLLQPRCHNPTGADLTQQQWLSILNIVKQRQLIPFFDMAYLGFADDLVQDTYAIQQALSHNITFLVSNSFSKNFSLYGERCGCLSVVTPSKKQADLVMSEIKTFIRSSYSCPPIYGSRIIETILANSELKNSWVEELNGMTQRIKLMRSKLTAGLINSTYPDPQRFIRQQGMFSYTGLNESQLDILKNRYAIYLVPPGRMCVAGLNHHNIDYVVSAILNVI